MKNLDDYQLIKMYQIGNEKAIEVLISRHQKEIFSTIFYKVLDDDLSNDIFQDTFMKAIVFIKENRYNDEGKFVIWLKRIANNLIIDYYRAKSRKKTISETQQNEQEFSIFDFLPSNTDNIEEQLVKSQIIEDIKKMLIYLPENQQEIIQLRFFEELSFKEIAEKTNTSINTTLGRVRYAIINLRKMMNDNNIILSLE
ncbi:MAG: sigma-70 family RNA polymerase sigma factor [Bacteroidetes bacterium]|jgi:RNA polymerase sigma-70 factor (ECF subfamily)|nr:sigma-70 family RNA polymerase sigma factor [Bacteroidota bacterium]